MAIIKFSSQVCMISALLLRPSLLVTVNTVISGDFKYDTCKSINFPENKCKCGWSPTKSMMSFSLMDALVLGTLLHSAIQRIVRNALSNYTLSETRSESILEEEIWIYIQSTIFSSILSFYNFIKAVHDPCQSRGWPRKNGKIKRMKNRTVVFFQNGNLTDVNVYLIR